MNNLFIDVEPSLSDIRQVRTLASFSLTDDEYGRLNSYLTAREYVRAYLLAESLVKIPSTDIQMELENKLFEISVNYGYKTKLQ